MDSKIGKNKEAFYDHDLHYEHQDRDGVYIDSKHGTHFLQANHTEVGSISPRMPIFNPTGVYPKYVTPNMRLTISFFGPLSKALHDSLLKGDLSTIRLNHSGGKHRFKNMRMESFHIRTKHKSFDGKLIIYECELELVQENP